MPVTLRRLWPAALAGALALACGTMYIQERIAPADLLSNVGVEDHPIPLSTRTYDRVAVLRMERELIQLCEEATDREMPPSIVFAVGDDQGVILERAFGFARLERGRPQPASTNTLYDIASLTKVVATTTAVLQLVDRGQVELDAPIVRYLPEYDNHGKGEITVRQCLTHTAGFAPFYRLWTLASNEAEARRYIENCELEGEPGAQYAYSDLGFITLGWLVERVSGESLDAYCQRNIFGPLGMTQTMFNPPEALWPMCAATEFDRQIRQRVVQGQVHDENSFFLGGVAGHAGVFSTADDLARFCLMLLRGGELHGQRILSPEILAEMTRVQIDMADSEGQRVNRGLGWWLRSAGGFLETCGGEDFSDAAFGHTGFTGPAIQVDPERQIFAVFLCNRLHSRSTTQGEDWRSESYSAMRPVRVGFFDTVAENLR
jgi:CubicO group peptidase (beta-lactamase class C family)